MKRSRKAKALGAPTGQEKILGVPAGLLAFGVLGAIGLAYANSGSATSGAPSPAPAAAGGKTTIPTVPGHSTTRPTTTTSSGTSTSPSAVKPFRRALVAAGSPLLYVFVNSIGGEGIFDRLKNTSSLLDGNGLNRIVTLDNNEFVGWATGNEWIAPDTLNVYTQVYQSIGRIGYNFWIQKSETTQVHAQAANIGYGQAYNLKHQTADHQATIQAFYFNNYTF